MSGCFSKNIQIGAERELWDETFEAKQRRESYPENI
jgi:hypothetical protein